MKKYFFFFLFLSFLFPRLCFSQTKRITYEEAKSGQVDTIQLSEIERRLGYRKTSLDFHDTMRRIAEPSTISFLGLDHTFQLDRSQQKKMFMLNADVQMPITLGGKVWMTGAKRGNPAFHTFHIVPQFKVRIFQDDEKFDDRSFPVRTPSYLPGVTYFYSRKKSWTPRSYDEEGEVDAYQKGIFYGLRLFHHSNGQDGAEFTSDGELNVYNGNFGENVIPEFIIGGVKESKTAKLGGRFFDLSKLKIVKKMLGAESLTPNRHVYWKLGFEPHIKKMFGFETTSPAFDSLNLYGRYRLNGQLGVAVIPSFVELLKVGDKEVVVAKEKEKEMLRLVLNFNYILDRKYYRGRISDLEEVSFFNLKRRLNLYATLHVRIIGAQHASCFMQFGYFGSDNYNIYFQQSLFHFRAGISMAFYKYPTTGGFE